MCRLHVHPPSWIIVVTLLSMCSFPYYSHPPTPLNKSSLACVCVNLSCVLASRRSSNASEKKRAKSSARSKSPFRSFRFKKKEKEKETGSGHYSDDEENYDRTIGKIGTLGGCGSLLLVADHLLLGLESACPSNTLCCTRFRFSRG